MADDVLAEALARIEHKVDALMKHLNVVSSPMHFQGNACPACGVFVDYQIDVVKGVVVRKCNCKTGKVPPAVPLVPMQQPQSGAQGNARPSISEDISSLIGEAVSQNGSRRKGG
jgi:hypothetical protein